MLGRGFLNQYSTQFRVDSTGAVAVDFGFAASHLRLANRGGVPWRFSLNSTVASTESPELRAGETVSLDGLGVTGVALVSTSTTTSTGNDQTLLEVNAWGG